jgi:hypothetical protein
MATAIKNTHVVANTNSKNFRTINVVVSKAPNVPQHAHVAVISGHGIATVQDSGGSVKGLPNVYVTNYP